ncbi:hypothetical protein IF2G_00071 [Cordyceps javanica]|nr:hypothetical protein IF2G_00071 [Cordyceps javanica]
MQNAAEETNAFRHSPLARPIAIVHRQIDTLTRPVTAFLDSFIHADGLRNFVSATSNGMPCLASKRSSFPFSINCARYRFLELFPTTSRPGLHLAAAREAVLRHAKYGLLTGQRDNMTARWIEQLSPSFSHCGVILRGCQPYVLPASLPVLYQYLSALFNYTSWRQVASTTNSTSPSDEEVEADMSASPLGWPGWRLLAYFVAIAGTPSLRASLLVSHNTTTTTTTISIPQEEGFLQHHPDGCMKKYFGRQPGSAAAPKYRPLPYKLQGWVDQHIIMLLLPPHPPHNLQEQPFSRCTRGEAGKPPAPDMMPKVMSYIQERGNGIMNPLDVQETCRVPRRKGKRQCSNPHVQSWQLLHTVTSTCMQLGLTTWRGGLGPVPCDDCNVQHKQDRHVSQYYVGRRA